ncbi:MAG: hypothetical protein DWP97_12870 [Calditrichaeota bacterium]|nr:MAG: hypothetical protein DWP97_12870 [Calditrichota bacterium]
MGIENLIVLFVTLFIWNIFELVMLKNWVSWFYMLSIPIYKKEFHFSQYIGHKELVAKISDPIEGKNIVVYHLFDDNKIGFREVHKTAFFKRRLNYTPLMRGLIEYNLMTKTMTIKGLLNLSTLFFLGVFLVFVAFRMNNVNGEIEIFKVLFMVMPFFVLGVIYFQQSKMFNEVVSYLKKLLGSVEY